MKIKDLKLIDLYVGILKTLMLKCLLKALMKNINTVTITELLTVIERLEKIASSISIKVLNLSSHLLDGDSR